MQHHDEDNQTTENVKLLQQVLYILSKQWSFMLALQQLQQQKQLLTSQQEYLAQLQEKETTVVVSEAPPPSLSSSSSESSGEVNPSIIIDKISLDDEVNDYNEGLATFTPFPDKPHIKSK